MSIPPLLETKTSEAVVYRTQGSVALPKLQSSRRRSDSPPTSSTDSLSSSSIEEEDKVKSSGDFGRWIWDNLKFVLRPLNPFSGSGNNPYEP